MRYRLPLEEAILESESFVYCTLNCAHINWRENSVVCSLLFGERGRVKTWVQIRFEIFQLHWEFAPACLECQIGGFEVVGLLYWSIKTSKLNQAQIKYFKCAFKKKMYLNPGLAVCDLKLCVANISQNSSNSTLYTRGIKLIPWRA